MSTSGNTHFSLPLGTPPLPDPETHGLVKGTVVIFGGIPPYILESPHPYHPAPPPSTLSNSSGLELMPRSFSFKTPAVDNSLVI